MEDKKKNKAVDKAGKNDFPGYPAYPASEDIYSHSKEETEVDPENPKALKTPVEDTGRLNEKNFRDDVSGSDLDIPGAELDDEQENIGSEDEENNLYSLGGDKES
jgi:hypothetical protein